MAGPDEIAKIALTISEAFNERQFERWLAVLAPDFEMLNMATGDVYRGPDGFRREANFLLTACPDCHSDVTSVMTTANRAVVEFVMRGTNTGPRISPSSTLPPTGRAIEVPYCEIYEVENGKIVRGRAYHNTGTVRGQLGLTGEAPLGAAAD